MWHSKPRHKHQCTNCGAPLYTVGQRYPGSDREHYRRMENECFGLPNGGMIVGIVIWCHHSPCRVRLVLASYRLTVDFFQFSGHYNNHLRLAHRVRRTFWKTQTIWRALLIPHPKRSVHMPHSFFYCSILREKS